MGLGLEAVGPQDPCSVLPLLLNVGIWVDAQHILPLELDEIADVVFVGVVETAFYDADDVGFIRLNRKDSHVELLTVVAQ